MKCFFKNYVIIKIKRFFKSEFNLIEFAAEGENHETIVERSNHNLYEYWRTGNNQDYKSLVSSLFDQEFVPEKFKKDVKEFILNIKIENSVKKSILRNQEANFEEIYCLFYVAGLLSYLLDCNIEYFTSVANTVGGCKYSLGSIAVGYKTEILSNDTRAFFSIISNHIASNLASQILLESNNMKYYLTMREGQEQFISNFSLHYELGTNSLHCGKKNEEGYSLKNKNLTTDFVFPLNWTNYTKEEIEKSFGEGFIEYLKTVLDHEEIDWGMYEGYHGLADCCNKVNSFYKKYIISDCSGLDLVLLDNQINPKKEEVKIIKPKVNVYLPHLLINKIENDKKRKVEVINTKTEKAKAIIEVKYEQPINIMHLVEALVKDTKAGGSFPDFIRNNYDAFRICGDLVVKGPKDLFEISLKNDFKVVSVKEGSPTKLLFIGNPNPIKETNELTFEIHYNLF